MGQDPRKEIDELERLRQALESARRRIAELEADESERHQAEGPLRFAHDRLERMVAERTVDLTRANRALQAEMLERRQAQLALQANERRMLQAQKLESLGLLAGGIAHDFNNLLMAILGNAELASLALPEDSAVRENLETIVKTTQRAAELTDQMLAYAGKGRFLVVPHDLNGIIADMDSLLHSAVSKKASLEIRLATRLPAVEADATQLRQIVLNLVTNASESLGDGRGRIVVRTDLVRLAGPELEALEAFEPLSEGDYALLEVSDTGCGMDEQTRSRIFEPFFTTKFAGRGLGLAAIQGIVRGHHGALQVESRPGRGSTFRLFLPACTKATVARPGDGPAVGCGRGRGLVLLVDDEQTVREVARKMLARLGFEVLLARDGYEAIEQYRAQADRLACVLLDLHMPGMDGEEAFEAMRRIRGDVPVLLSSGFGADDSIQRFTGRGLADFIQKPYRLATLESTLRGVLGR